MKDCFSKSLITISHIVDEIEGSHAQFILDEDNWVVRVAVNVDPKQIEGLALTLGLPFITVRAVILTHELGHALGALTNGVNSPWEINQVAMEIEAWEIAKELSPSSRVSAFEKVREYAMTSYLK